MLRYIKKKNRQNSICPGRGGEGRKKLSLEIAPAQTHSASAQPRVHLVERPNCQGPCLRKKINIRHPGLDGETQKKKKRSGQDHEALQGVEKKTGLGFRKMKNLNFSGRGRPPLEVCSNLPMSRDGRVCGRVPVVRKLMWDSGQKLLVS